MLELCDMLGRVVRSQQVSGNGTMTLSNLPAGVYTYGLVVDKSRREMKTLVVK